MYFGISQEGCFDRTIIVQRAVPASGTGNTALPCRMSPTNSLLPQGDIPMSGQGGGIFGARKHGFAVQNVPHIFFLSCQKENVPDTVQKKKR